MMYLRDAGFVDQALALFDDNYKFADISNLKSCLMTLLFVCSDPDFILNQHKKINDFLVINDSCNHRREYGDKVRVGILSPDLHAHAVAYFLDPVLGHLDKNKFEVFVYNISNTHDDITKKLQSHGNVWRDMHLANDSTIVQQIKNDEIDILLDLAGHSSDSRTYVIAAKPAPIICNWLGYLSTTGMESVDYRLVDNITDPVGITDGYHNEKLARIDGCQWCYTPQNDTLTQIDSPFQDNQYITFGSFNQCAKISQTSLGLWAGLLNRIENSRIVFTGVKKGMARERIERFFDAMNISRNRYEFYDRVNWHEYFEMYNKVDIALDTYPYSGATTTLDALVMGVPVISLSGMTSISKSTKSILNCLGYDEWVSDSEEGYYRCALDLINRIQQNPKFKQQLRDEFLESNLVNAPVFAKNLEKTLLQMLV